MRRHPKAAAVATLLVIASTLGLYWAAASSLSVTSSDLAATAGSVTLTTTPTLTPSSLALNNGGANTRKMQQSDTIVVDFSSDVDASSLCPGKSAASQFSISTTTGQGATSLTVTVVDNFKGGNDAIVVSEAGACTGDALGFASGTTGTAGGYIDLGSQGWVTAGNRQFGGNNTNTSMFAFDGNKRVTITLGSLAGSGTSLTQPQDATVATYHPDSAITSRAGAPISGTAATTTTDLF